MKATGEVMAIDRSFEGALMKAVRSLETNANDIGWEDKRWTSLEQIEPLIRRPNDIRLWAVAAALRRGVCVDDIHAWSKIDRWFLEKLAHLIDLEKQIAAGPLTDDLLWECKRSGFSDDQIGRLAGTSAAAIRGRRESVGMNPVYKMVDTCAGEFASNTPYF
jgi:carbamoyl-phosphate synthase large subunit